MDSICQCRLDLLTGGFSKFGGRRTRCIGKCRSGEGKETDDGWEGGNGCAQVVGEHVVRMVGVGADGLTIGMLGEERVVLGGTDGGKIARGSRESCRHYQLITLRFS